MQNELFCFFFFFFAPMYNAMDINKIFNYKKGINMKKWLKISGALLPLVALPATVVACNANKTTEDKIDKLINLAVEFSFKSFEKSGNPVSEEIKKQTIEQTKNIIKSYWKKQLDSATTPEAKEKLNKELDKAIKEIEDKIKELN